MPRNENIALIENINKIIKTYKEKKEVYPTVSDIQKILTKININYTTSYLYHIIQKNNIKEVKKTKRNPALKLYNKDSKEYLEILQNMEKICLQIEQEKLKRKGGKKNLLNIYINILRKYKYFNSYTDDKILKKKFLHIKNEDYKKSNRQL